MSGIRLAQLPGTEGKPTSVRVVHAALACLRTISELARARIVFARKTPRDLLAQNTQLAATCRGAESGNRDDQLSAVKVAFMMPRMAKRVPWRADCLVQAIAAQHWLATLGIASRVVIGTERDRAKPFSAHAWLVYGATVVTGGDVEPFETLMGGEASDGTQYRVAGIEKKG